MSGSGEDRSVTDWRTESAWCRRKPGAGWLLAFLVVPLLLALIGVAGINGAKEDVELTLPSIAPSATLTAPVISTTVALPATDFAPLSIERASNGFTLNGELPDEATKASLLESLRQALPGVGLVYNLRVTPGVKPPEFAGLGGLFGTAMEIPNFSLKLLGDTVTLTGTASSQELKAAAEAAAAATWPNVKIRNDIQVVAASSTAKPGPGLGTGGGTCATLKADLTSLLKTPINFGTNGTTLAADSSRLVAQIASKVKGCRDVKVAVTGYTDNTGSDALNVPLSANRAKVVADALVANGVAGASVSSSGAGSANPVANNDSPVGRAKNRRVEITVG